MFPQVYYIAIMTANLNFPDNCLRILSADCVQLRAEIERDIFYNASERLFLTLQII